jgi:hypothetical protein
LFLSLLVRFPSGKECCIDCDLSVIEGEIESAPVSDIVCGLSVIAGLRLLAWRSYKKRH